MTGFSPCLPIVADLDCGESGHIGLYKTEPIRRRGPWAGLDQVELATLEWGRLVTTTAGCTPPAGTFHRQSSKSSTTVTTTAPTPPRPNN